MSPRAVHKGRACAGRFLRELRDRGISHVIHTPGFVCGVLGVQPSRAARGRKRGDGFVRTPGRDTRGRHPVPSVFAGSWIFTQLRRAFRQNRVLLGEQLQRAAREQGMTNRVGEGQSEPRACSRREWRGPPGTRVRVQPHVRVA